MMVAKIKARDEMLKITIDINWDKVWIFIEMNSGPFVLWFFSYTYEKLVVSDGNIWRNVRK